MPPGVHSYTIPRVDFSWFVDMEIYVKAVNELGEATSATIKLEPVTAGERYRKYASIEKKKNVIVSIVGKQLPPSKCNLSAVIFDKMIILP